MELLLSTEARMVVFHKEKRFMKCFRTPEVIRIFSNRYTVVEHYGPFSVEIKGVYDDW